MRIGILQSNRVIIIYDICISSGSQIAQTRKQMKLLQTKYIFVRVDSEHGIDKISQKTKGQLEGKIPRKIINLRHTGYRIH